MAILFTSDTHFNHANVIKYCNRPFANVEEMNRTMIERWQETVKPEDTVYHLGDFAFGKKEAAEEILRQLPGEKILIRGNHDRRSCTAFREMGFALVDDGLLAGQINGMRVYMTHRPVPPESGEIVLCGHVHEKWKRRGNIINVGVDQWDFRPVSLEILLEAEEG